MIQSETEDQLLEIKNNLQGNNSRVEKAENQINDLEHKEAKDNQSEEHEEKKNKKKIWSETKDTLIEIKNNLQGNKSRMDEAENQINDLEHKEAKNNQSEQKEEKRIPKNKDSVSSFQGNFQHSNICIIGVPEGEEKEQEIGNLFEKIMNKSSLIW